jgi:hypothetical protein
MPIGRGSARLAIARLERIAEVRRERINVANQRREAAVADRDRERRKWAGKQASRQALDCLPPETNVERS